MSESHEWIPKSLRDGDPRCLENTDELIARIDLIGLLPLFSNSVPGFSVEEMTSGRHWWTGDSKDPWQWRMILASGHEVAYGKFFRGRAGFISLDFLPHFMNWKRDGYDFDSLWDEGLTTVRSKKIMDCFSKGEELFSFEAKQKAGFGKGGEKNFEGTVTSLQEKGYLVMSDFSQRTNKKGEKYGWSIAKFSTPESVWGYDTVTSAYTYEPGESEKIIRERIRKIYNTDDETIRKVIG